MNKILRVVVDTNVFISAFLIKSSIPYLILEAVRSQKCILIMSPAILGEIEEVINRQKIIQRTKTTKEERKTFIQNIIDISFFVLDQNILNVIKENPDDDKFLSAAFLSNADYIISGDKHLLNLKTYKDIKIIEPSEFVNLLNKTQK